MKPFLALWYGEQMNPNSMSKEDGEKVINEWGVFLGDLGKRGLLVDANPIIPGGKTITATGVTGYKPMKSDVNGYLVFKAKDIDEAVAICRKAPEMAKNTIIVREAVDMSGNH